MASYVLALEKKDGSGEKKICLKYIRSVQRLFEGEKVTYRNKRTVTRSLAEKYTDF